MKPELHDAAPLIAQPKPAAAHELLPIAREDRPVLNPVRALGLELDLEPRSNRPLVERTARIDERGHARVAPQRLRKREVLLAPRAEDESLGVGRS